MKSDSTLKIIADNPLLLTELRKVFDAEFETQPIELGLSNERLGERERARLEGKLAIDKAFIKISAYQTPPVKVEKENPAR